MINYNFKKIKFLSKSQKYIKLRNITQLKGKNVETKKLKDDYYPVETNHDMRKEKNRLNGSLEQDNVAVQCGSIAQSFLMIHMN